MGTPEFPNLGKHCAVDDCKQIDFLPFTCDSCHRVFCLEHRSYTQHKCPHANREDVTVVICPLCAKGVRLVPDEDANITWERHVNTECDPSNYEKVTKKKRCPAPGCREVLVFSNTIKCRDCDVDHCLRHRFGQDHKCPAPRKLETSFQFLSLLSRNQKEPKPKRGPPQSSSASTWTRLANAASSVRASAEASMAKPAGQSNNQVGAKKVAIDACPKCSKGFIDPVKLVEHLEKDHGGNSKV